MKEPGRRFDLVLRLVSSGAAVTSLAGMALGGSLELVALLLAGAAVVAYLLGQRPPLGPRGWVLVQLLFIGWLAFAGIALRVHVLVLFGWLLLFVQGHRLLTRSGPKDEVYVVYIGFGQMLLASILTIEAAFFPLFVAFAVLASWSLLLARLAVTAEGGDTQGLAGVRGELDRLVRWPYLLGATAAGLGLVAGSLVIFFVLPRLQAGGLGGGLLPPVPTSGFSDRVRLGSLGTMQLSDEPVFRARFHGPSGAPAPAPTVVWKGLALDHFDGRTWSLSDPTRQEIVSTVREGGLGPPKAKDWTLRIDVETEPIDTRALFTVDRLVGLYGDFRGLEAAVTDGYALPGLPRRVKYVQYVDPLRLDPERLRQVDLDALGAEDRQRYTQLPEGLDPRITTLARSWTVGAASPLDEALLVRQHLSSEFRYDLDQAAGAYPDPLAAFLFELQEGHCEYFATGMAVLLRTRGIPARVVNGFLGGEWNPVGGYLLVRQRHAHSWVEVLFPGEGWRAFDPTPSGSNQGPQAELSWFGALLAWTDVGRVAWNDVMLDYGMERQSEGFRTGLGWFARLAPRSADDSPPDPSTGLPTLRVPRWAPWAALGALGLLLPLLRRAKAGAIPRSTARLLVRVSALVLLWEDDARRRGLPGPNPQTPLAWARWAAQQDPAWRDAPTLIDRWYAVRWGQATDPPLSRDLRRLPRRRSSSPQRQGVSAPKSTGQ